MGVACRIASPRTAHPRPKAMTTHPDTDRYRAWAHVGGWGLGMPMSLAGVVRAGLGLKLWQSLRQA